jgi:predicted ArsR family transcriptional regulator
MEELSEVRRNILRLLKSDRAMPIAAIAERLDITYEGTRQHVTAMEREGWVRGRIVRGKRGAVGRPISHYSLTEAGDHLFPKHYDLLAIKLVEATGELFGDDALKTLLAAITDAQVAKWEPLVRGKSLPERLAVLRDLYLQDDPFMSTESASGELRLVERNCPFLNVAMKHPALCSTSVATISRLLGCKVIREERFQAGDQRCVFHVLTNEPIDLAAQTFQLEPEK